MVSNTPSLLTKFLGHVYFFPLPYNLDSLPASGAFGFYSANNLFTTGCITTSNASGVSFESLVKVTTFRY